MEQAEVQKHKQAHHSYWNSVLIAGFIFGILVFVISLLSKYLIIHSAPSASPFSPGKILSSLTYLLGMFGGGLLATWYYNKQFNVSVTIGRAAMMGFLTGVIVVFVSIVLNQIWHLVDPGMVQRSIQSEIANIKAMNLPPAQKSKLIDVISKSSNSGGNIFKLLFQGIPLYGILNMITGMIGAKIFGKKEHNEEEIYDGDVRTARE
jgi:hypothetical protein